MPFAYYSRLSAEERRIDRQSDAVTAFPLPGAHALRRTALHEFCHHLDYELLRFPDSFHTDGFYKRESGLLHRLMGEERGAGSGPGATTGVA